MTGLFGELPVQHRKGVAWVRYPAACGAHYEMTVDGNPNGWWVKHCGHPTANRPYYLESPAGEVSGRKFTHLETAKAAIVEIVR